MKQRLKQVDPDNARLASRANYGDTLDSIVAAGFCPFCEEHLFKHHKRPVLMKNRYWLATENAWPYEGAGVHILFIARCHVETTGELSPAMWLGLHALYKKIVAQYQLRGETLLMRSGDTQLTGATVNHLHAQLVAGGPRTPAAEPILTVVGFKK
jgi:ATP adenylyltransferase